LGAGHAGDLVGGERAAGVAQRDHGRAVAVGGGRVDVDVGGGREREGVDELAELGGAGAAEVLRLVEDLGRDGDAGGDGRRRAARLVGGLGHDGEDLHVERDLAAGGGVHVDRVRHRLRRAAERAPARPRHLTPHGRGEGRAAGDLGGGVAALAGDGHRDGRAGGVRGDLDVDKGTGGEGHRRHPVAAAGDCAGATGGGGAVRGGGGGARGGGGG